MSELLSNKEILAKWDGVLGDTQYGKINSVEKALVTARLLENTAKETAGDRQFAGQGLLSEAAPATNISGVQTYDPVAIDLVRRSAPNLVAYDLCGVVPMYGPTSLIFAWRSNYANTTANTAEAFYNEANTGFTTIRVGNTQVVGDANLNLGGNTSVPVSGNAEVYNYAGGMTTANMEAIGTSGSPAIPQMNFTLDKIVATARGRALKAEYTLEVAQDLKSIHGLDADGELSKMLQTELLADINREVIRALVVTAKWGSQNTTTAGTFDLDVDSNGRWMGEKYAGLHMQIELDANQIAKETRFGKGNILLCSSDVASALSMAKVINFNAAAALQVDDTGSTFAGTTTSGMKVYIDPYAAGNYAVVGYKGEGNMWGFAYCPYTPIQRMMAVNYSSFNPAIGYKTRYAMVANPFSRGATASDGSLVANANVFYRRSIISNIL